MPAAPHELRSETDAPPGDAAVVHVTDVTRRFGARTALDRVSLSIPEGSVTGLVGENGAGKTTLIKHILGLLRAQAGGVRVFGLDPAEQPVPVLAQVGYLSEEPDLPGWMRVRELMRYVAAFYPTWDERYATRLLEQFALDPGARIKTLSKGQRARAGLLVALAYRPRLLVLDEPSSGLDPVVRRDILAAIIRTVAEEGRTVLFSSHLLSEVERVCDRVAMLHRGRLVFDGDLGDIKQAHRRVTLRFDGPITGPPALPNAFGWTGGGHEWTALFESPTEHVETAAERVGARIVDRAAPSLDEIFFARAGTRR